MYFCPISKVPHPKGTNGSRYERGFALAQWVRESSEYGAFYREKRLRGEHVILDNGAYENEMLSFRDLYEACVSINPSVLVAPDFLEQPAESMYVSKEFLAFWKDCGGRHLMPGVELMFVLQAKYGEPLISYIERAMEVPKEFTWIGIPKRLTICGVYANLSRPAVVQALAKNVMKDRKFHLLGVTDMLEAHEARSQDIAISIDSKKDPDWFALWK